MTKVIAKDIAKSLIAVSGLQFDSKGFIGSELSLQDENKILQEIAVICNKMIDEIEKKYYIQMPERTDLIVSAINNISKKINK